MFSWLSFLEVDALFTITLHDDMGPIFKWSYELVDLKFDNFMTPAFEIESVHNKNLLLLKSFNVVIENCDKHIILEGAVSLSTL